MEQSRERSCALPTPGCSSYWKGSLLVALNHGHQLLLIPGHKVVNTTCVLKYQILYSKRRCACVYKGKIDGGLLWLTPCGDRYIQGLAPFTRGLLQSQFSVGVSPGPTPSWCLSADCSPIDWPPGSLGSKNLCIVYFLDAHTFFCSLNWRDLFPTFLVNLGAYPVLTSLTNRSLKCQ